MSRGHRTIATTGGCFGSGYGVVVFGRKGRLVLTGAFQEFLDCPGRTSLLLVITEGPEVRFPQFLLLFLNLLLAFTSALDLFQ